MLYGSHLQVRPIYATFTTVHKCYTTDYLQAYAIGSGKYQECFCLLVCICLPVPVAMVAFNSSLIVTNEGDAGFVVCAGIVSGSIGVDVTVSFNYTLQDEACKNLHILRSTLMPTLLVWIHLKKPETL